MPPNSKDIPIDQIDRFEHLKLPSDIGTDYTFKRKWVWFNIIGFIILHLCCLYGVRRMSLCNFWTLLWAGAVTVGSGEGVTIGAHRLYAHKGFKARFLLRLGLMILQTIAGQNCMYIWVRDHRLHHKYSDTDADPHNANRGFFFSHMGWLLAKKHPAVIAKGKTIDMSDLEADFLVMFQKFFYKPLYLVFAVAVPIAVPIYLWDETYLNSLFVAYFARYIIGLNITWLVNSAAHFYGTKPYDKGMRPVESKFVSFMTIGEGWHNYHHAFPWDYRAAEYGTSFSFTTLFIDILAKMGFAYDLRETPSHLIESRVWRTGDGSHPICTNTEGDVDVNGNAIDQSKLKNELRSNEVMATGIMEKKDL